MRTTKEERKSISMFYNSEVIKGMSDDIEELEAKLKIAREALEYFKDYDVIKAKEVLGKIDEKL